MNEELFGELLASVREGGAILRGEKAPSRRFVIPAPDVKQIREPDAPSQCESPKMKTPRPIPVNQFTG